MPTPLHTDSDQRNQRILIIDDNAAIHEDVRKILGAPAKEDAELDSEAAALFGVAPEELGGIEFEIDSAFQGQDGLAMVKRALEEGRPYAMAFVDVRMPPGWDGIETISKIWKEYPQLQVVICTAYSDYSWEEMIRKVGKTDSLVILKKPFDNVEVLQLAHTLTQKWTLSHRLENHLAGLDEIVARRTEELQKSNARLCDEMLERERTEHELRRSDERFAKAFQASPIPMAIQPPATGRFIDVNDAFLAMTGYQRDEIIGRMPAELSLCPDAARQADLMGRLQMKESVRNFECELRTRHGELRECVVSAEAFDLAGEAVALIATLDVSEQRSLEKQLRHSQKLEAIGQFASGVAHDFNNMLTVIQGYTSIHLAAARTDSDLTQTLGQVYGAAERAAALTRQLLTFSRKQIVLPRVLDVNLTVENLGGMLRRLIGEHIDLRCELAGSLPSIYADESNLEQMVVNLVVNSRDAMLHSGRLTIRTEALEILPEQLKGRPQARAGSFVCLSVGDNGCGMNAETLSHIFEPFFTTKEVGKGTGLGLSTVYGIVQNQCGWIEVVSEVGAGTTFSIFLPVSTELPESVDSADESELRGGTETILVVEDETAVRGILTRVLRNQGYEVLEAADGPAAMETWSERAGEIDLLMTDIVMPNGVQGNVLAERLQAEKADLKVIFSSGYSADFGTESLPLSEGSNFLGKPYKPDVLVRAVRECLDR